MGFYFYFYLQEGERVGIIGSHDALGSWSLSQVLPLLPLHASYMPLTCLLHAFYTPFTRLLHASYTPFTRLGPLAGAPAASGLQYPGEEAGVV